MKATRSLLWFKNDLRLLDNETLTKALHESDSILPIYIFDPRHWQDTPYGFKKAGYKRFLFLAATLQNLQANITALGGKLYIQVGLPEEILPRLVEEYGIERIYTEEAYASEEIQVLQQVQQAIPKNVELIQVWGKTLYHKADLPYAIEDIPKTSKAFRINTTKKAGVRKMYEVPQQIRVIEAELPTDLPTPEALGLERDKKVTPYLPGGEDAALERLAYYTFETELLTSYKWTRNRSLGMDFSSKLSAYFALGALSPRTVYWKVKDYEQQVKKNISTWWLVFEVVWRDFFTFKGMRMGSAIFTTQGYTKRTLEFENNTTYFKRWCEGQTGIPFIDAHMRQLNHTGFMSNRGRVNCSSYLIHDLKIDWTWGAAYFESHLIDYDVSANWMNWHVQAYEIWYTNPVNQSLKYKAKEFIQTYIPELAPVEDELIYIPWEMDPPPADYPSPIAVYSKWTRAINKIKTAAGVE
ncbi:DASH family cryptochrome [Gangjinia marincola]|uniref:Cryptochrome DASH n=1 Tax=Gangjinia marincola TaxID=578463 RepID=A0ABN1MIS0_9FLAO